MIERAQDVAAPEFWREYLDQGEVWASTQTLTMGQFTPIADMPPEDRINRARWLLRRADRIAALLPGQRVTIPDRWMRSSRLYRALVERLPDDRGELVAVMLRARHRITCLWRATGGQQPCSGCGNGRGPLWEITSTDVEQLQRDILMARMWRR